MTGLLRLFSGLFATFAFSWVGLALIPNFQIGHLDPQADEEGTDVYPLPQSGMAERGRRVYTANGCFYCHSQQLRSEYVASDLDRTRDRNPNDKWGARRSAPRDYVFDRPVMIGKTRTGPDLANIGKAAPQEAEAAASPAAPGGSPPPEPPQGAPAASPGGASPAAGGAPPPPGGASPAAPAPGAAPSAGAPPRGSPAPAPGAASAAAPPPPGVESPAASAPAAASPAAATSPPIAAPPSASKPGEPPPYSPAWHHLHLYSPRSINGDSNMPAYRFLYEKHRISGRRSLDALDLGGSEAPGEGWEIIPTYDAKCLVAYLMSRDQSHPLKEVKSAAPVASPGASPSPAPPAAPK